MTAIESLLLCLENTLNSTCTKLHVCYITETADGVCFTLCGISSGIIILYILIHSPVVILRQLYKSSIIEQLLNDGTILLFRSITDVNLVWLANLCLFIDEFLYGRREITQFHTTGGAVKLSSWTHYAVGKLTSILLEMVPCPASANNSIIIVINTSTSDSKIKYT